MKNEASLDFDAVRVQEEAHRSTFPAIRPAQAPVVVNPANMTSQDMIAYALTNDKLDALDKLIAMKNAEEDRAARIEFDKHFAEMQKDYRPVKRASTNKQFNSAYADINDIMAVYGPILARHGFSATWDEAIMPDQAGWKLVTSLITGYGYTKKSSFPCPPPESLGLNDKGNDKGANPLQRQGVQTAYGRRQSFTSNAGVLMTDEDQDGGSFEDGVKLGQFFQLIRDAKTQAERKAAYMMAIKAEGVTDREKVLLSAESTKRARELHAAGVTE